jgi:Uma2 family endonuclease
VETTTLDLHRVVGGDLDDAALLRLAEDNPHLVFERDPAGRLVVTPPLGGESARREVDVVRRLAEWNDQHQAGCVFSSQVLFRLPSGALRGPDASWVAAHRWDALTPAEREGFPPLAPDFAVEIRSRSDARSTLEAKMAEYREAGVRLGWLLDPIAETATVYRVDGTVTTRPLALPLSGEDVMLGFVYVWEHDRGER